MARMTAPHCEGISAALRKGISGWLILLGALGAGSPAWAQDSAATVIGRDSSRIARADSALPDTARAPAADGARPAPPPPPVDKALGKACTASGGGAPDLLIVTFRRDVTPEERSAVAEEVGGTLRGPSEHAAPGSWYIEIPGSAGDPSVADKLILLDPVVEVGTTRCP
jgi:hypothetical protein